MTFSATVVDEAGNDSNFSELLVKPAFAADGSLTIVDQDGEMIWPAGKVVSLLTSQEEEDKPESDPIPSSTTPETADLSHPYNPIHKPWWRTFFNGH